jgi:hypothetical protein
MKLRKVTLAELRTIADASRDAVWQNAKSVGRDAKIYLHWSAGRYDTCFDDYHINITGNGDIYVSTEDFAETLSHTWKRNTGSIGISLCCCYNATSEDLGEYPPTQAQIETMAQVIWIVADALWLSIDKNHVLTHGEGADNEDGEYCHEPYGPKSTCERWDLEYLGTEDSPCFNPWAEDGSRGGDVLRGKANFYRNTYGNGMEADI